MVRYFSPGSDPSTVTDYAAGHNLTCKGMTASAGELLGDGSGVCTGSDVGMPAGNSQWSIAAYFRSSAVLANGADQTLIVWGTQVLNGVIVAAQYTTPLYCGTKDTFAVTLLGALSCGNTTIADGKDHWVVTTYDQASISIYVDGALQTVNPYRGVNVILPGNLSVMADWKGLAGDMAIWNRALSATEIASQFADPWQVIRAVPGIMPPAGVAKVFVTCMDMAGTLGLCDIESLILKNVAQLGATTGPQGIQGVQGPRGDAGQPGSGALNLLCGTTPCIAIGPANAQLQMTYDPDPTTGTYTIGNSKTIGSITHVGDTVTGLEVFPTAYSVVGNVVTLNTPTGHPLYFIWWAQ